MYTYIFLVGVFQSELISLFRQIRCKLFRQFRLSFKSSAILSFVRRGYQARLSKKELKLGREYSSQVSTLCNSGLSHRPLRKKWGEISK